MVTYTHLQRVVATCTHLQRVVVQYVAGGQQTIDTRQQRARLGRVITLDVTAADVTDVNTVTQHVIDDVKIAQPWRDRLQQRRYRHYALCNKQRQLRNCACISSQSCHLGSSKTTNIISKQQLLRPADTLAH